MSVHVRGSFPSPLYRAFTEEEYALDFVERGNLIMRSLSFFQEIEDPIRKDKDEGEGRVKTIRPRPVIDLEHGSVTQETGEVFFGTSSINPAYIVCFSGPQVDLNYLLAKGYQCIVRIDQPHTLVSEIGSYLERCPGMPGTMWLHCIQVRYDKGQLVEAIPEPGTEERLVMSFSQKAPRFGHDCEYRVVLRLPVTCDSPVEIKVELQKRLDYVGIVFPTSHRNPSV